MSKGKGLASGSNIKKSKLSDSDCDGSGDSLGRARMPSNSANPISEFYTHSRLHHLSQWSTEPKVFTPRMRTQITPKLVKLSTQRALRNDASKPC